ncbi:stage III sporulation protein AG [Salipaludibacillus agaradhaerens]|uniref:stage III sporulation protein AG n=1 Tax=Salipaludibacillus agaradhaerens TaxID=76935 RepID=UPI0021515F2A|nr:stage III sporulation protein AG [Salipaludibacillus agaradhaerens]MCR6106421.1 stage III sporulation protein AG [Salipaludibacillus agaradhaerens]MCR6118454.1 stage III sporulation protein AG [Salipaludibacillus agaradhaerens]
MTRKRGETSIFQSFSLKNKGKKIRLIYLLGLLVIGVVLMIIGSLFNKEEAYEPTLMMNESDDERREDVTTFKSDEQSEESLDKEEYEAFYEKELTHALEEIVGVSNVTVMVNTTGTSRQIYQTNDSKKEQLTEETDSEGGSRKVTDSSIDEQVVIVRRGENEEPLLVESQKPDISGVLIVANGVDNIQVKTWVVEAVSRVLDIPSHRVSVMPRKQKEDAS